MASINTPKSLIDAARALVPLVGALEASGDEGKQQQGDKLDAAITAAITQASNLAAADVIALLSGNEAVAQLKALDAQAKDAAQQIAADEQRAADAISFCTSAAKFGGAVAIGDGITAAAQLGSMLKAFKSYPASS